ncbi:MAG: hypothetical protein ACJA01_003330 [Saprospiraceae bacterium]|jgi:hypothetical protein
MKPENSILFANIAFVSIFMMFTLQDFSQKICTDPFLVKIINPGENPNPHYFTEFASSLFFGADDGTNGD